MKPSPRLILIIAAMIMAQMLSAQTDKSSFKFGKPTQEELQLTSCALDPDADQVILFEYYDYAIETSNSGLLQKRTITRRVKVLKESGVSAGDLSFEIAHGKAKYVENISKLDAVAINVADNGKTVSSSLKNNMIFKEDVSSTRQLVKASVPDVKVGTIIDYKVTITSDNVTSIPTIYLQHSVPVIIAEADVHMPDFIVFYADFNELIHPITKNITYEEMRINNSGSTLSYQERWISGRTASVPPVKNEPFVWNLLDFKSNMSFELKSVELPGEQPRSFSYTWDDVFKMLKDDDEFGGHLKMSDPLKDEVAQAIAGKDSDRDKVKAILDLLSKKVTWNENYSIWSSNPKNALKEGKGNSADINFLLMSMLSDAGVRCTPVLLNPKDIKNFSKYPTLKDINYFILAARIDDGGTEKTVYLDGTDKWSSIDVIPSNLLSFNAILYNEPEATRKVDLSSIAKGSTNYIMKAVVGEDGMIETDLTAITAGMDALSLNGKIDSYKSEDEFLKEYMKDGAVSNVSGNITRNRDQVTMNVKFEVQPEESGDIIYIKPSLVDLINTDIFTSETRMLPVDMDYPSSIVLRATVMLGDKWTLEGTPQSSSFSLGDKDITFSYKALKGSGMIQIVMELRQKEFYFTADRYETLRNFFNETHNVLEGRIALRKVS
ncbi:MAG: DUF3857 domain-containing protein [Bacteroidales bacterium]|nr:DUF3857 domain-containing protein [Bacteroidales bacterium]